MSWKRLLQSGLAVVALVLWGGPALAQDAQVYELTENMKILAHKGNPALRKATSEILGFIEAGKPLCPAYLAEDIPGRGPVCTVNITGTDNIKLSTGLGTLKGDFTVVVQDGVSIDSPEVVVAKGKFKGNMDFSPALLDGIPFGTVIGDFRSDGSGPIPFSGVFLLPFPCSSPPDPACYLTYSLVGGSVVPTGETPVIADELAIGFPTVRFDIYFQ